MAQKRPQQSLSDLDVLSINLSKHLKNDGQIRNNERSIIDLEKNKDDESNKNEIDDVIQTSTCIICMCAWNTSDHRACCLPCGHLFGYRCIAQWLEEQKKTKKQRRCPYCFAKANRIIPLFNVPFIPPLAPEERQQYERQLNEMRCLLESEQKKMRELEMQLRSFRQSVALSTSASVSVAPSAPPLQPISSPAPKQNTAETIDITPHFTFHSHIPLPEKCHGVAYSAQLQLLVVSCQRTGQSPSGGLVKLSLHDPHNPQHLWFHNAIIRDVKVSPHEPWKVVTVSLDCRVIVTNLRTNCTIVTFVLDVPAWSCCWDEDDPNYVYCGLQDSSVVIFDLRYPQMYKARLTNEVTNQPLHSLYYVSAHWTAQGHFVPAGLLSASVRGVQFWSKSHFFQTYSISLPHDGGVCLSVCFDAKTCLCVASLRPLSVLTRVHHILFELRAEGRGAHILNTFDTEYSSTLRHLMPRSVLFSVPPSTLANTPSTATDMTPASSLLLIFPEGGRVQVYHARCGRLAQSLDNETLTNAIAIQGLFFIPPSTSPSTIFLAIDRKSVV